MVSGNQLLGDLSSEGTHFLFTPNLFGLRHESIGADKKMDSQKLGHLQVKQLHDMLGGTWVYGNDGHSPDIPGMDMD